MKWPNVPDNVRDLAGRLVETLLHELGDNALGIYLHGSLALGGFQPERSDLDILVVTKESTDIQVKQRLAEKLLLLSLHPIPVELHICAFDQLQPWKYPYPFDMHYSEGWRGRLASGLSAGTSEALPVMSGGEDPDLAAHITVVRERGIVMWGRPVAEAFPPVPAEHYLDAILSDVDVEFGAISKQPVYYVLNLLRVVKYVSDGSVVSKEEAGVWGLAAMPFHIEVIAMALQFYRRPERNESLHFDVEPLRLFMKSCRARITRDEAP
ncbi:aminoglycoside adenylyltransferase domain-containing protein [Paenibacillus alkalitolerans]|uniref:aminoglycoside adenylyltransferase domain-containing protein n=1 Tax=Paenibacillus alkalitolerans TaxID=2799335 RepID=UPI0018F68E0B|nr:aminoglycoside adenylyltransferase domain-containing protein [Paenibacillus alkalitolerans]